MTKHIEILVTDIHTGEIIHRIRKTCTLEIHEDFDDWMIRLAGGFCRLIKKSSDQVITISCEDYKQPQDLFLPDVY